MIPNPLRRLPTVHDLLESPPLRALAQRIHRNAVVSTIRTVLDEVRQEFHTAASDRSLPNLSELAERIVRRVAQRPCRAAPWAINATGTILHASLGPPPLAEEAIAEMAAAARHYWAGAADVSLGPERAEIAPDPFSRAPFSRVIEGLLCELTGAEAALVAGSMAGAKMLALSALAAGRQLLVCGGQWNRSDGDRLPAIARLAGAELAAAGNAEWAAIDDYAGAMNQRTAAVMLAHVDQPADAKAAGLAELVELCRGRHVPLIYDLGAGGLMGLPEIMGKKGAVPISAQHPPGHSGKLDLTPCSPPTARDSIATGADVVLMRGDMLLGGPSCGILLGRKPLVEQIARAPMAQVLWPAKPSLAALAATLQLYHEPDKARLGIPVLRLLTTSAENLRNRAERLAPQAAATAAVAEAKAIADVAYLRGVGWDAQMGTLPFFPEAAKLPTWCVAIRPASGSVERLAESLRAGALPVFGRLSEDRLLLDLRSVLPCHDLELIDALGALE